MMIVTVLVVMRTAANATSTSSARRDKGVTVFTTPALVAGSGPGPRVQAVVVVAVSVTITITTTAAADRLKPSTILKIVLLPHGIVSIQILKLIKL